MTVGTGTRRVPLQSSGFTKPRGCAMYRMHGVMLAGLLVAGFAFSPASPAAVSTQTGFTLEQVLSYPFPLDLTAARHGDRIAWVIDQNGVRNVWVAKAPDFKPHQVTRFTQDDGQEITQLTISPVDLHANTTRELSEGDAPALSSDGRLAYIKDDQVWTAPLAANSKTKPKRLFFDHGKDGDLHWAPDGKRLAFVSNRDDHAFIAVFTDEHTPILYLSPSTGNDGDPRWSPDGTHIAFTRQPGNGGPPQPILTQTPQPWSIRVADTRTGQSRVVWQSPDTLVGSYPQTAGSSNLHWADGGSKLVFLADLDGWPHLYSVDANGGAPLLLTPGKFMVEDVVMAPGGRSIVYSANTGTTRDDNDRRHLFEVSVDRADAKSLTSGRGIQTSPTAAGSGIAYIDAGAQRPPLVSVMQADGDGQRALQADLI